MTVSTTRTMCLTAGLIGLFMMGACATAPRSDEGKAEIVRDADVALAKAKDVDPTLVPVLGDAAGYAVFPSIGKGGAVVGGAYGKGVLYEGGRAVGYCDLSQATIGAQLGGQAFTQIVAFETSEALETFKRGDLRFSAQTTAVAVRSGAGANAKYADGVAAFIMDEAGLMVEASVGGQQFSYQAK